jgi:superfamily II DNA or RNA helicase
MRNDGLDLVLEAITGPIVYRMTVRQGVDQGYLAKPIFTVISVDSKASFNSRDANEMTRRHLYYNPEVNAAAGDIANKSIELLGRPTMILVEEIEQFTHLLPYLRHRAVFAHGGVTAENKDKLPVEYHKSDPDALVADFNAGKVNLLVGTSCIATGTDIQAARQIIYLRGGKSEIQVKQAVGRGTRLCEGKTDCYFTDFDVKNIDTTHRHAMERASIYADIYDPPRMAEW